MNKNTKIEEDNHSTVSLPEEVMEEILLRLPVKSVLRFKCVCKSWLSLLSSPQFAQSHFDLAVAPSHRLLLRFTGDLIESFDPEAPLRDPSAIVHLRLPPLPRHILPCLPRHLRYSFNRIQVCGSCRGFVLVHQYVPSISGCPSDHLVVWNPSTGVHKQIPPFPLVNDMAAPLRGFGFGFGYDASTDDYLVIRIDFVMDNAVYIKTFSLKSDSWDCNYIETKRLYELSLDFDFKAGSFLNGALHWVVMADEDRILIAFDLVERSLSEIPMPPILSENCWRRYWWHGLRIIGGCLGVWVQNLRATRSGWQLWIMKEYKVLSSWTMSFDLLGDRPLHRRFSPLYLTKDNALFGSDLDHRRLLKLCGETNNWLKGGFSYGNGQDSHTCNLQCSLYRESLLSLPRI